MNRRTLRSTAGLAGTFAAAAAGALTVGLISGVVHTAQTASASNNSTTNSGTSNTGTAKSGTSHRSKTNNSTSGIGSVPQNVQPVGGSHGS